MEFDPNMTCVGDSPAAQHFAATYPPRSGASRLAVIDDSGAEDMVEVLVEGPGTDLVLGLSDEGEVGLYGASSELLIYYLSEADAPLFERIAAKLRERAAEAKEAAQVKELLDDATFSAFCRETEDQ